MSIKWANKALIALCLTLAITLVLMVYTLPVRNQPLQ